MNHCYENGRERNNTRKHFVRLTIGLCIMALAALLWEFFIADEMASANSVSVAQSFTYALFAITLEVASGARIVFES